MNKNASPDPTPAGAPSPRINYQCNPDLDLKQDLTVDAVSLFQRFRQAGDVAAVDALLDQEFARHIKHCELAILQAAQSDIFWCELPRHPLDGFNVWTSDHLRSLLAGTRVGFVNVKSHATDLRLLASWLEDGLDVPVASTIPVRDVAAGLRRLKESGGRIAVQVAGGF